MDAVDGVLLDIGVSSYQLDTPERGFSYHHDAPLDMRMSQEGPTARDLVNTLSQQELADIIFRYGEDKSARRIAQGIVQAREEAPIETTAQLAEIIKASVPAAVRRAEGHPARRLSPSIRWRTASSSSKCTIGAKAVSAPRTSPCVCAGASPRAGWCIKRGWLPPPRRWPKTPGPAAPGCG